MNKNVVIGVIVGLVVAAGAAFGTYMLLQGGGDGKTSGPVKAGGEKLTDAIAKQRADRLVAHYTAQLGKNPQYKDKVAIAYGKALARGGAVVIEKVEVKFDGKPAVTIDEVVINDLDWSNLDLPSRSDVEYKGIRVPALASDKNGAQARMALQMAGVKDLVLNIKGKSLMDRAAKTYKLNGFVVELVGLLTVSLEADLLDIDAEKLKKLSEMGSVSADQQKSNAMLREALGDAKIKSAAITLKDDGLFKAAMTIAGGMGGKSVDDMKKQMKAQLGAAKAQFTDKLMGELFTALEKFIDNPKSLSFRMNPPTPVSIGQIEAVNANPKDAESMNKLKALLGLAITANE
jgi:hypothetical protein